MNDETVRKNEQGKDQKGKMDNNNGWNQVRGKQNQIWNPKVPQEERVTIETNTQFDALEEEDGMQ